jgi:glycosyltransferase involved in cell wall biosynthesis
MKRVVHLSSAHPASDTRICVKECRSLARAGYDVTLIARSDVDQIKQDVKIMALPPRGGGRLGRIFLTTLDVFKKAWRCRADLYHFHDPELIPVGIALRAGGARVIYDVHEHVPKDILSKSWIPGLLRVPTALVVGMLEQLAAAFAFSGVIGSSPSIAQRFPPAKSALVQNFPIVDELVRSEVATPMAERPACVLYAGNITAIRGIREMVAAMELVTTADARLVLAGEFDDSGLEQETKALAGWRHVDGRGWLDRHQLAGLFGEARAGLVVPHPEPNNLICYPVKLFEYMSAGLPVIASDFPLHRPIVDGAQCGLLVKPLDPAAIAEAIDWLLAHPGEAEAMGRRGRDAVAKTYNWAMEEKKLLAMYQRLLDRSPHSVAVHSTV